MDLIVKPSAVLKGDITVPGDKSISHRALMIGALAQGITTLTGFLQSKDCLATLKAMQLLGVSIEQTSENIIIHGKGLTHFKAPSMPIDCGNSGTSMRLLAGLLAGQPFDSVLKGDSSLQQRPMARITQPLSLMGANIQGNHEKMLAPLMIKGRPLQGIEYTLPIESAQIKSCLLLAGLYANEPTIIKEKGQARDHTERMLKLFGCDIHSLPNQITLKPGNELQGQALIIPGDISSAAFFIAMASALPGAQLCVRQVGVNERRVGLLHILQKMGAHITLTNQQIRNDEAIADIYVTGRQLQGIEIPQEWVVSAIDEFPILFVIAAMTQGETIIHGIAELRVKESDRIAAMCTGLKTLGISLEELPDGVIISGGALQGGVVESFGDHRIAMAFAMAAFSAKKEIKIKDCDNISTSFPEFCSLASQVGLDINKA